MPPPTNAHPNAPTSQHAVRGLLGAGMRAKLRQAGVYPPMNQQERQGYEQWLQQQGRAAAMKELLDLKGGDDEQQFLRQATGPDGKLSWENYRRAAAQRLVEKGY